MLSRTEQIRHSEALAEESITTREEILRANARRKSFFSPFPFSFSRPRRRQAFTLAEVLITLGIIGVVAAMTIPTLINNYQKTQYVVQLKKAYTQMNQALLQMAVDSGTNDNISSYFGSDLTATGDAIASYYKTIKNCRTSTGQGCITKFKGTYDGSDAGFYDFDNDGNRYKFVSSDGVAIAIYSWKNNCTNNGGFSAVPDSPTYNSVCASVTIDVNGEQRPNYAGRDVFIFSITSNKTPMLYPWGGFYDSGANTGTATTGGDNYWNYNASNRCGGSSYKDGWLCPGRIIEKGWKMDY